MKEHVIPQNELTNMAYLLPSSVCSGAVGGLAGNFADVINIRIQNDSALDPHLRRKYKNAFDCPWRF